jgi:hypothetical protein
VGGGLDALFLSFGSLSAFSFLLRLGGQRLLPHHSDSSAFVGGHIPLCSLHLSHVSAKICASSSSYAHQLQMGRQASTLAIFMMISLPIRKSLGCVNLRNM